MHKIGLIGTENSHAMAFARYFNLPREDGSMNAPDFRVTAVYGPDPNSTRAIQEAVPGIEILDATDDFVGKVDCIMITCRKGSLHHAHAVKFAKLGIPLFVDKPFTSNPNEAFDLIQTAAEYGVPMVGGSSVKYSPDVPMLREKIEKGLAEGTLSSAVIHYAADLESVYDGFWFYASHSVELMFELFGYGIRRITANANGRAVTAIISYDKLDVTLQYNPDCYAPGLLLVGKNGAEHQMVSMDGIFDAEAEHFAEMARTGKPNQTPEELVRPVLVIDAILRSIREEKQIEFTFA